MNNKWISAPAALLILVFFFLPWVTLDAAGPQPLTLSGYALATVPPGVAWESIGDPMLLLIPLIAALALILVVLAWYQAAWQMGASGAQIGLALLGIGVLIWEWLALQDEAATSLGVTLLPAFWATAVSFLLLVGGGLLGLRSQPDAAADLFGPDDPALAAPASRPAQPDTPWFEEVSLPDPPPSDHMATWVAGSEDNPVFSDARPPLEKRSDPTPSSSLETEVDFGETPPRQVRPPFDKTEVLPDPVAALPEPPPAWLVVREGIGTGEQFRLQRQTRLGREPDNEIVLQDTAVSSYHARVTFTQDQFTFEDLGSTNGSYLYEPKIDHWRRIEAPVPLVDGMQIKIGRLVLHFTTV